MNHDVCYARARCEYDNCKNADKKTNEAESSCDGELYSCLQRLGNPNVYSLAAEPVFSILELVPALRF
jgi:hypothetical protein